MEGLQRLGNLLHSLRPGGQLRPGWRRTTAAAAGGTAAAVGRRCHASCGTETSGVPSSGTSSSGTGSTGSTSSSGTASSGTESSGIRRCCGHTVVAGAEGLQSLGNGLPHRALAARQPELLHEHLLQHRPQRIRVLALVQTLRGPAEAHGSANHRGTQRRCLCICGRWLCAGPGHCNPVPESGAARSTRVLEVKLWNGGWGGGVGGLDVSGGGGG